jgi:DNA-binding beta-propeller fold protein YncE
LSSCGRFLIGKGADRKTDPDHVLGRLSILDAVAGEVCVTLDLKDVYPSTYRFSPDGTLLYVTTAATGKGAQRDYLKKDVIYVYDTSALPKISLVKEIRVGEADCSRRPIAFLRHGMQAHRIFVPNPSEGTLSIIDGARSTVLETVRISDRPVEEVNFALLNAANFYGC